VGRVWVARVTIGNKGYYFVVEIRLAWLLPGDGPGRGEVDGGFPEEDAGFLLIGVLDFEPAVEIGISEMEIAT
jgi:hypothetical protein